MVIDLQPSVFVFPVFANVQAIADDQIVSSVAQKQSMAEISRCMALPNTYTKLKGSEKKGKVLFDCLTGFSHAGET